MESKKTTKDEKDGENPLIFLLSLVMLAIIVVSLVYCFSIQESNNKMGEMICQEENPNAEYQGFDRETKTVECKVSNFKNYDGGRIKITSE